MLPFHWLIYATFPIPTCHVHANNSCLLSKSFVSKLVCVQCGTYAQSIANCQAYIVLIISWSPLVDGNQHKVFSGILSNGRFFGGLVGGLDVKKYPQANIPLSSVLSDSTIAKHYLQQPTNPWLILHIHTHNKNHTSEQTVNAWLIPWSNRKG